ncbi:MAG: Alginate biosynthesis protein AlgA [Spirochaetes bacterium ADurb.Bin110]|nr:MAG: Alginate biosynthesis protein AlgA [Spirochaetes bacterium ADurb.Bin110]
MTTIVLSGGGGTRLWPLSRQALPKQYCDLLNGPTLFERTIKRNIKFSDNLIVAINVSHFDIAKSQLEKVCPHKSARFILEPCGRNTAPAITLACLALDPDELVLVVPSDHIILDEEAYEDAVNRALVAASLGYLVTFGLKPEYAETGYGYIEVDSDEEAAEKEFHHVRAFKEKPDRATAEAYIATGRYYWNSGMFAFLAGKYLNELGKTAAEILMASEKAWKIARRSILPGGIGEVITIPQEEMFLIPAESIDYAVMEKSQNVAVVPCSFGWSDLGSWDAIWNIREKSGIEAIEEPSIISVDSKRNLIIGSERLVALVDIEDLIVVDTPDALMISRRGSSQEVKKIVEILKEKGKTHLL